MVGGEAARLFVSVDAQVAGAVRGMQQVDTSVRRLAATPDPVITPKVNTTQATGALAGLKAKIGGLGGSAGGGLMQGLVGGLVGGASMAVVTGGIGAVTMAVSALATGMIGGASQMEKYTVQLGVLLGGTTQAKNRMAELVEFAKTTPFELPEVVEASKSLEVFTKGALSTGAGLTLVGDIASGTSMQFGEAAMWVGRLYDALQSGRPIGEAAMRLQEVGALSGEARAKLEALAESVKKGAITGTEAWATAAAEFSRYSGMMAKQAETLAGKQSNLADAFGQMLTKAGTTALPILKSGVDALITSLDVLQAALNPVADAWAAFWTAAEPPGWVTQGMGQKQKIIGPGDIQGDALVQMSPKEQVVPKWQQWDPAEFNRKSAAESAARAVEEAKKQAEQIGKGFGTGLTTSMTESSRRAAEIAAMIPSEMGDALRANRTGWIDALTSLQTAMKSSMTRAREVGFILAALAGEAIVAGLKSKDKAYKAQTTATVGVMVARLVELQGPTWTAAYNFGSGVPAAMAAAILAGRNKVANATTTLAEEVAYIAGRGKLPKPVVPVTPDYTGGDKEYEEWLKDHSDAAGAGATKAVAATKAEVAGVRASFRDLGASMLTIPDFVNNAAYKAALAAYAGLSAASKLTGDAGSAAMQKIEDALSKANTVAATRIAGLQKALTDLKASLSSWPSFTAAGILAGLEAVTRKLTQAWATLDAQQKTNAIQSAASEVIRREELSKQPANVQAVYAQIDIQNALEKQFEAAANKAKPGSPEQNAAIAGAVAAAAEVARLTKRAADLIEANAQAEAAWTAFVRTQTEASPGYVAPTGVDQAYADWQKAEANRAALMAPITVGAAGGQPLTVAGAATTAPSAPAPVAPVITPASVAAAVTAALPPPGGGTLIVQIGADILARITDEMLYVRSGLTTVPVQ